MYVSISKKMSNGHWNIYIGGVQVGHIVRQKWTSYDWVYQVMGYYDRTRSKGRTFQLMQFDTLKEAKTYVKESLSSLDDFIWQMQKYLSHRLETNFKEK